MRRAVFLFFVCAALSSCRKSTLSEVSPVTTTPPAAEVVQVKIDACALLLKEEIAGIQDTEIIDVKGSESMDGALRVSQCYYAAKESSKSVSLTLTQNKGGKADRDEVGAYWKQTFGRFKNAEETEGAVTIYRSKAVMFAGRVVPLRVKLILKLPPWATFCVDGVAVKVVPEVPV